MMKTAFSSSGINNTFPVGPTAGRQGNFMTKNFQHN